MKHSFLFRSSLLSSFLSASVALVACTAPGGGADAGSSDSDGGDGDGSKSSGDGDGDGEGGLILGDGDGDGDASKTECKINPITGMEVCVCIKITTWGALGTYGAVPGMDGTDAITAWLNANSTGDADYFAAKPVIDEASLANYDVIILQDLSAWPAFSEAEIAAFNAWILAGGGVISLNGYSANGSEMNNVNALLAASGMSYVANSDTSGTASGACAYCYGNSVPQAGWTTHPIAANLTQVGAFHGRSVTAGDGEIVAQGADGVYGATKALGEGRVFMFHDEWVTYNSQWTGENIPGSESCHVDPNNQCYGEGPAEKYSSAQFWYNSIKWAGGDRECFEVHVPGIVK